MYKSVLLSCLSMLHAATLFGEEYNSTPYGPTPYTRVNAKAHDHENTGKVRLVSVIDNTTKQIIWQAGNPTINTAVMQSCATGS
jgi:hypothetical protein